MWKGENEQLTRTSFNEATRDSTHLWIPESQLVLCLFQNDVNVLYGQLANPGGRMTVSTMLGEVTFEVRP